MTEVLISKIYSGDFQCAILHGTRDFKVDIPAGLVLSQQRHRRPSPRVPVDAEFLGQALIADDDCFRLRRIIDHEQAELKGSFLPDVETQVKRRLAEVMRAESQKKVRNAMLSRAVAGRSLVYRKERRWLWTATTRS